MDVIILAAGYATRLYPLTLDRAKPLLEVAGKPMIEWVLDNLANVPGLGTIYIVTNDKFVNDFQTWTDRYQHRQSQLKFKVINDGSKSDDDKLGAIGDINFVVTRENLTENDLLIVAGDNLFSESLAGFVEYAKKTEATVAVYDVGDLEKIKKYGNITIDSDNVKMALDYAAAHNVVLVAAAADNPGTEQGDPANVVQPMGTGANLSRGIGLDVTAADYSGNRASFAGYGSEISLAAYGALKPQDTGLLGLSAPEPGLFGAFPANSTDLEAFPDSCGCRATFQNSNRYAYLQGTSMAAPQVAAAAALMRQLNPYASLTDVITTLKVTAQRPAGTGWTSDLGWGILNAGAALQAIRRIDRLPPVAELLAPRTSRQRQFLLRWSGHDQQRPGLIASGIARYDIYVRVNGGRSRLLANTTRHALKFRGRPGFRYVFYAVAVDRAGNRERHPTDVTTRVARHAR